MGGETGLKKIGPEHLGHWRSRKESWKSLWDFKQEPDWNSIFSSFIDIELIYNMVLCLKYTM